MFNNTFTKQEYFLCRVDGAIMITETGSDDDGLDLSEDDFFLSGSSSDEVDVDDELTDQSARKQARCQESKARCQVSIYKQLYHHGSVGFYFYGRKSYIVSKTLMTISPSIFH